MRVPYLFRRRVDDDPRTPIAIPFTMEDFAEMEDYAAVLAPYGVSWRVDALDRDRPEVAIIYRNGMLIFELWSTTAGLLLRCMDPNRDAGTMEVPNQHRAWMLVCALTTPAIWLDGEQESRTGNRVVECLLRWLRA